MRVTKWRGAWKSNLTYQINDVVYYNGSYYVAIASSYGTLPLNSAVWSSGNISGFLPTDPLPTTKNPAVRTWLASYNADTGSFTQVQPSAADLSDGTTGVGKVVLASAGVPAGGSIGQALVKNSNTDYDTAWEVVSTEAAGSDTQIQYNKSSAFGADASFTWDYTNKILTVSGELNVPTISNIVSLSPPIYGVVTINSVLNSTGGFQVNGIATNGNVLRGNGTNFTSDQLQFNDLGGIAQTSQGGTGQNSTAVFPVSGIVSVTSQIPLASTSPPLMDGSPPLVGFSTDYARSDHVHPSDTTKINWRGAWFGAVSYYANDLVLYSDGSCYLALSPNTNVIPNANPTIWQIIGDSVAKPTDAYALSDIDDIGSPAYYGYLKPDGSWYIKEYIVTSEEFRFIQGGTNYLTNWTNRTLLTYQLYSDAF